MASAFMMGAPQYVVAGRIGLRLVDQLQRRRGVQGLRPPRLLQATEAVQDVVLGGFTDFQRLDDGLFHELLIVQQHKRQDIAHLAVATGALEQPALQAPKALRQLCKRRAVAQGAGSNR